MEEIHSPVHSFTICCTTKPCNTEVKDQTWSLDHESPDICPPTNKNNVHVYICVFIHLGQTVFDLCYNLHQGESPKEALKWC